MQLRFLGVVGLALVCACSSSRSSRTQYPQNPPPGQYPPGQYQQYPPQGQQYPPQGQQYPPQGQPVGTPPPAGQGTLPPAIPAGPVLADPINSVDIGWLRGRAQTVLTELVSALPGAQQQKVAGIPLIVDDGVGEVNAFAACTKGGKSAMAISDGLLDISAHLAQAKANDEVFGTQLLNPYIELIARHQRPKQPIVRPAPGFFNPAQQADARKVQRQHQLLDEQLAFILGHELAHHYLGHLPCTAGGGLSSAELGHVLSSVVPGFNQPNELAADVAGTNNLLTAGKRRSSNQFTEGGALLTMAFFSGLDRLTPGDIIFGFERSHPPPQLRSPVISQTANSWRANGGQPMLFPF